MDEQQKKKTKHGNFSFINSIQINADMNIQANFSISRCKILRWIQFLFIVLCSSVLPLEIHNS